MIKNKYFKIFFIVIFIIFSLMVYTYYGTYNYEPNQEIDITKIIEKNKLTNEEYQIIFEQTGLSKIGYDSLENKQEALFFQKQYLNPMEVVKNEFLSITIEDKNSVDGRVRPASYLVDLKAGDLIISFSNRTMGVDHGHSAIMIDEDRTLVISNLFDKSRISSPASMAIYANFMILRPNFDNDFEGYFQENLKTLTGKSYNFWARKNSEEYNGGWCSYLTYYPYLNQGYDIDSNGGYFVLPYDVVDSDLLDIVQIYGLNSSEYLAKINDQNYR